MSEPAGQLAARGFAVFVVHYFDRTGTVTATDKRTIFGNFPAWGKTVWDAVGHVAEHPQVDAERIGLLGFSLGGYLALSVASVDSRVKAVVEFFGGLPREMKLFMRRLCPVLILHGAEDETVPVGEAYELEKELQRRGIPYEMKIYEGTGHGFSGEVWRDASARTLAFLQEAPLGKLWTGVSCAPLGLCSFLSMGTHGLCRGLHSSAGARLRRNKCFQ